MATENKGHCVSLLASGDLSASQYRFMTLNASAQIAQTGAGAGADGILQDDPNAAGRPGAVMVGAGISKIVTGAAVTAGAEAASDATGRAVDAVTGDVVNGKFLEASGGAGEIVSILFAGGKATT